MQFLKFQNCDSYVHGEYICQKLIYQYSLHISTHPIKLVYYRSKYPKPKEINKLYAIKNKMCMYIHRIQ